MLKGNIENIPLVPCLYDWGRNCDVNSAPADGIWTRWCRYQRSSSTTAGKEGEQELCENENKTCTDRTSSSAYNTKTYSSDKAEGRPQQHQSTSTHTLNVPASVRFGDCKQEPLFYLHNFQVILHPLPSGARCQHKRISQETGFVTITVKVFFRND